MKFFNKYQRLFIITLLSSATIGPILTSCGSSGGDETTAGIGGTGITQGKITGFGSIFVNGIEFDTNQSTFEVDGDTTLNEDDLAIGMVVKITGSVSSDGLEGTAANVEYDDEVQGPVEIIADPDLEDGQKTLTIFGITVIIDESNTSFDDTSFDTIKKDDIVEVSGFKTSATEIQATYVEKTGKFEVGEDVELKGKISSLNLILNKFNIGTITITYDNDTEIEVLGGLANGLFVEVEGKLQSASSILAREIELEDEDFEDGDEISLQGVISNFSDISDFTINGQEVDASNASLSPANATLENGVNVEVDGDIVNGVLIADEVELREGEVKIKAFVSNVNLSNNQIEFSFLSGTGSILVTVDNQTEFEDETGSSGTFSLDQVMPGDFIKIEGIDAGNQIMASQVKKLDPSGEDVEVQGSVENFTDIGTVSSITLFGVIFNVNNVTNPGFGIGDIVEIIDEGPIFGIIDDIELDD